MPRVRRSPEQAQHLILHAAEGEFLARGYEGFQMTAVAKRAGVSRPLVAHYFGNRDVLLKAVVARAFASLSDSVTELLQSAVDGGDDQDLPVLLIKVMHKALAEHARMIVFTLVSGRKNLIPVAEIRSLLEAIHGIRVQNHGEVPFQDTVFSVGMPFFAILLQLISDNLIGDLEPALADPVESALQFQQWLATLTSAHIEGRIVPPEPS